MLAGVLASCECEEVTFGGSLHLLAIYKVLQHLQHRNRAWRDRSSAMSYLLVPGGSKSHSGFCLPLQRHVTQENFMVLLPWCAIFSCRGLSWEGGSLSSSKSEINSLLVKVQ